ncbi:MAG: transketolase C-terminal domain-containing protein [Burkholderiaceae bacterium]
MTLSTMTYAQAAANALDRALSENSAVVALGEDVGRGGIFGQYKGLTEAHGSSRVFDTPISESTIVGAAVGMALTGLRPVVEMRVVDFALCAIDEIVNQAAKNRFMFGGQGRVPVVLRLPNGIWTASAAQHSQSLEAWFAHIPGLVVVAPATASDNYHLLRAAIASDDPIVYFEHKELWGESGEVDTDDDTQAVLGKARVAREGKDLTLVSWSKAVCWCEQAAELLAADGMSVEVIDLRTIWPWDREAVLASARRTGRMLVVHEAVQTAGFGAEVVATVVERVPPGSVRVGRIAPPRLPVGYSPGLEAAVRIDGERIAERVRAWMSA